MQYQIQNGTQSDGYAGVTTYSRRKLHVFSYQTSNLYSGQRLTVYALVREQRYLHPPYIAQKDDSTIQIVMKRQRSF